MEKNTKKKAIRLTMKFPRCVRCRERAYAGDLDVLLEMVRTQLINKTGKNTPITITIEKY